jgi:DNA mismatch repair ATPase MutS
VVHQKADGVAVFSAAKAVVELLGRAYRKRGRFLAMKGTQPHEIGTALFELHVAAHDLHHVRAREWKGDLVLLHELAKGPADKSYGLAVARLAGVPAPVVKRAKAVLDKLEKGRAATGGLAAGLDDLPLFAAALDVAEEKVDALREKLGAIDIDSLSPRAALDLLYDLKREL